MKTRNNNGISVRLLVMILALTLIVGGIVAGSVAWLTATSGPVTNTFTVGDINITLTETTGGTNREFKMVPGNTIAKDPKVAVVAGSEACWLFVSIEKTNNPDYYLSYGIAQGWTQLEDKNGNKVEGVYYRQVDQTTANAGVTYDILSGNQVTVKDSVTKSDMNALSTSSNYPKLTFTAYAVQLQKGNSQFSAYDAWLEVAP